MWEIPALAVLNELRSRGVLKGMGRFELQVLYARAMTRVWEKIERLKQLPELSISDFGTRRRHGFLWQDWCVQAMIEGLGASFLGTSNCLIALRREVEAIGTNAHELPMVYAALSRYRRGARARALSRAAGLAGGLPGQPPRHPARHLRHHELPQARARLGGVLDRHPHRFEGSDRGRRGGDRLVAVARPGPAREARDLLGRARRRHDHRHPPAVPRPHARRLRLGHAAHQRLPRPRAERRARRRSRSSAR